MPTPPSILRLHDTLVWQKTAGLLQQHLNECDAIEVSPTATAAEKTAASDRSQALLALVSQLAVAGFREIDAHTQNEARWAEIRAAAKNAEAAAAQQAQAKASLDQLKGWVDQLSKLVGLFTALAV